MASLFPLRPSHVMNENAEVHLGPLGPRVIWEAKTRPKDVCVLAEWVQASSLGGDEVEQGDPNHRPAT